MADTDKLVVYKNRTNRVPLNLGINTEGDTFTSEIRAHIGGPVIAEWTIVPESDGSDGKYIMTIDNSLLSSVEYQTGVMDVKRVSGGEPLPVFRNPIEVEFVDSVTA